MSQKADDLKYSGGLTRLYVDTPLAAGATFDLSQPQSHLIANVLRAKSGDALRLFNGSEGEWRAVVANIAKRTVTLTVESRTRNQDHVPDLWLLLAPIKKTPLDYIVQKATELGVARIQPVITRRTIVERVNIDRMRANVVEAAEQSERLSVPTIVEPVPLERAIRDWETSRQLMFCDEAGDAKPAASALASLLKSPWAILTGPEGGFEPVERDMLRRQSFVTPVSLGPRILRADTAALAAITIWQSTVGDWG